MRTFAKLLFSCGAILVLCLSLVACAEEKKNETKTEPSTEPNPPMFETYDYSEKIELLDNTETWLGLANEGTLKDKGVFKTVTLNSSKDLDPYRNYMQNLSKEDEKRMFEDEKGKVILIELTADSDYTTYSTATIQKFGSTFAVLLNKEEASEPMETHTFFLLYFPGTLYNGENIEVSF